MDKDYLSYYGLEDWISQFKGVYIVNENLRLWSWSITPKKWTKTVLFLHGFLDHSLTSATFIKWLLEQGFRVVAGDMPGHGRSKGTRGGINSFADYQGYLLSLLKQWKVDPLETYAVGHSTGAAILVDYCRSDLTPFRGLVFVTPLVKMNYYAMVNRGIDLAKGRIDNLPVRRTKPSSNRSFLKFRWNDPLGAKRFSLSWFMAMVEWNRDWKDFTSNDPVLIVQGERDKVVEWRSNIPILQRCFKNLDIIYFPKGKHHLLNEVEKIQNQVYRRIKSFLNNHHDQQTRA